MKKKFSKILGIGLTLALLGSLLLTAPVSALTQPDVTVDNPEISATTFYTIMFTLGEGLAAGEDIIIVFPAGTNISGIGDVADDDGDRVILDDPGDDVTVAATSGIGTEPVPVTSTTSAITTDDTLTIDTPAAIGAGATVQVIVSGVVNPADPEDYTLDVSTSEEAAVTSADYEIEAPTILDLPGIVKVYNPSDILMAQETGDDAIADAIAAAGEGYTIEIGPGTYTENPDTADAEVTFVATGTAAETIIVGNWTVDVDDITIDGLTLDGDIVVTADDFILQNSVIDDGGTLELNGGATDATVEDTTFNVEDDVGIEVDEDDATITGSIFNIEENGIGIVVEDGGTDTAVEDSTFSGSSGVGINVTNAASVLSAEGNTFDGLATALDIDAGTVTIKFNTIINSVDWGLDTTVALDVTFNWWGTAVAADIDDMIEGAGDYEPFLTGTADAVLLASDFAVNATSLDAKDTVGVYVVDTTNPAGVIVLAKYTANPQEAIADAVAFFDVYVGTPTNATDDVSLRFYVGDENSILYVWSRDTDKWVELDAAGFSVFGGYVYVTVDADVLGRTPFVVVAPPAVAPTLAAPTITTGMPGAVDVSLTPTFDWAPVADADAYYFELADNPLFVMPLISFVGDLGRLIETAYTHTPGLDYSTPYHWRVRAVSGTIAAGDLLESAWVENVFITMDEPVEPTPPVEIVEAPPVVLEPPDVIVTLPTPTPITPAWIYVIIGVGAVLVIALLVLIVRTRRVA